MSNVESRNGAGAPEHGAKEALAERDLAGALHEVSNALTVVLGWIEGARESAGGAHLASSLDVAITRARIAHRIVRRAIGADVAGDEPRTALAIARDAVLGLEPEARRAHVRIVTSLDPALEEADVAAPTNVLQILTNLLMNAIAASPKEGVVTIDGHLEGGNVVLGVADEGAGVPIERRERIFSAGVSTREGGAGIGLRHASALAKAAGGTLLLAEARGRGARFELAWPFSIPRPAGLSVTPASRRRIDLGGARILVVEDDASVVELLDTALGARGATVVAVRKRADLEAALASGSFDAALLDLSPIQGDVVGALAAVREANPAAKLLLISGSSVNLPDIPRHLDSAWIRKPFEIGEIVRALADH